MSIQCSHCYYYCPFNTWKSWAIQQLCLHSMQTLLAIVSAFTLSGNVFTASSIFVSISILNIMRVPMGLLPIFIAITVQVWLNCIQWLKNASWVCYIRLKICIQIFWCDWRNSQLVTKRVIFFFPFLFFAWDNQWNSIFSFNSQQILVNKVSNDRKCSITSYYEDKLMIFYENLEIFGNK